MTQHNERVFFSSGTQLQPYCLPFRAPLFEGQNREQEKSAKSMQAVGIVMLALMTAAAAWRPSRRGI